MNFPTQHDSAKPDGDQVAPSRRLPPRRLLTRRRFLTASVGGVATAGGLVGWATQIEPHWVQVTHHSLGLAGLPKSLRGKRLVQISDLHVGVTDEAYLESAIAMTNELNADILVVTGDIIDHPHPGAADGITRLLSKLRLGSIATLGCLGNHDYGRFWSQTDVANSVAVSMQRCGINVLRNEFVTVEGMRFYGLDDLWSPLFNAACLDQAAPSPRDSITLCHNPDACDQPVWSNFQGVVLAGHTHGGQCKPPLLNPPRLPVHNRRYVSGFYDVGPRRTLHINRGLGYGFRARFNCRPEITCFTLKNA